VTESTIKNTAAAGQYQEQGATWLTLPVVLAGTFMVVLDFFIVNVAIPATQRDLLASSAQIQFVVAGYGLAYACGLITAGRLGDLYGRRRLYVVGLIVFTVASLLCGIAPTATVLVVARVAQGCGAALLSPQVLTILGVTFTGHDRARAFTAYGLVLALASVGGQLIGGLLIKANIAGLDWRTCFLINVPIGLAALLLTRRHVPESRSGAGQRLDLVGAALVTVALVAVVLPLVEGRQQGWPVWAWACLAAAVPLLAAFGQYQRVLTRRDAAPLLNIGLFGQRAFTVGILAVLVFYVGVASFFLVLALYLQQGMGMDALGSGLTFAVMGVGFFVTSMSSRRLNAWFGRQALAIGAVLIAVGQVVLDVAVHHVGTTGGVGPLVPGLLLDGLGLGMVMAPLNSTVLAGIPPRFAGAASGVLTTMMQVGNSVGVAVFGVIFYGVLGTPPHRNAYPGALTTSLVYLAVFAVVLAVLIQLLPRKRPVAA
jgi:EmrB/QacA subfamily drug resistance transporter